MATKGRRLAAASAAWRLFRSSRHPDGLTVGDRLRAVPRMAVATLRGAYTGLDRTRLGFFALAVAYIISPVDFMPEAALWFIGVVDDIGVAMWLTGALLVEMDRFLAWEAERARVVPGEVLQES